MGDIQYGLKAHGFLLLLAEDEQGPFGRGQGVPERFLACFNQHVGDMYHLCVPAGVQASDDDLTSFADSLVHQGLVVPVGGEQVCLDGGVAQVS